MAYAPKAMSLGDWFRRLFSSPTEPATDDAEGDVSQMATAPEATAGGLGPGRPGTPAAAEAAQAEIEAEEAPPDPAP
jgi:hypothetical protein